jgi:hypothetical protein
MNEVDATKLQKFWDSLQRRHSREIGFLPAPKVFGEICKNRMIAQHDNDELAGFLLHGPIGPTLRVYQTCIALDARRRQLATDAIGELICRAELGNANLIALHCAADLDSNEFWRAMGFIEISRRVKSKRTYREQIQWARRVGTGITQSAIQIERAISSTKLELTDDHAPEFAPPTLKRFLGFEVK